jgi:hypothetical protein
MAARHLLRRRHRATTILISRPSCAGRPTDDCYSSDEAQGPGGIRRDLDFSTGAIFRLIAQGAVSKGLIILLQL